MDASPLLTSADSRPLWCVSAWERLRPGATVDVMELMFAEWEDGERFSFEDSDRFEEDSLCSFISEAESLCQNWRGWRKQSAGPNSPTVRVKDGHVIPLVELSAKQVAFHIPFEVVEKVYPPVPEQLSAPHRLLELPGERGGHQLLRHPRLTGTSSASAPSDSRMWILDFGGVERGLYSCLANGSPDEFQRGEQLYRIRAVKDPLQIGGWREAPGPPGPLRPGPALSPLCLLRIPPQRDRGVQPGGPVQGRLQRGGHVRPLPHHVLQLHLRRRGQMVRPCGGALPLQDPQCEPAPLGGGPWGRCSAPAHPACVCVCVCVCVRVFRPQPCVCGRPSPSPCPASRGTSSRSLLSTSSASCPSRSSPRLRGCWTSCCPLSPQPSTPCVELQTLQPDPQPQTRAPGIWTSPRSVTISRRRCTNSVAPPRLCSGRRAGASRLQPAAAAAAAKAACVGRSDVNSMYLSSTEPPAAAEWACLVRPLRGREPEGIWNLLSIVREMFKRRDSNAAPLLEILTEQCLTYEQIISWWYSVRTSASHSSASGHTGRSNGQSEVAAHACASMCDEMVVLWRLAVLDPTMSPCRSDSAPPCRPGVRRLQEGLALVLQAPGAGGPPEAVAPEGHRDREEGAAPQVPGQALPGLQGRRGGLLLQLGGGVSAGRHHLLHGRQEESAFCCVSLALEDAGPKCTYKGAAPPFGGKMKLPQVGAKGSSVGGPGGSGALAGSKHGSAKRRTSSEDSSLEPDLAELSLDDGSSLALGAEASNTFDLLPPAPDAPPSPSPLLRDSHKHGCSAGGSKMFETKCSSKSHPPSFPSKEAAGTGTDAPPAAGKEAQLEEEVVGEDDYQAYYVGVAPEDGMERQLADSLHQEEEPDIFAGIKPLDQENRMEAFSACAEALHAHGYSGEACRLAVELARDLLANPPDLKVEQPQTKVKLAYQESEVVALLKKIPLGLVEMSAIRERAEQLRDGSFCDYRPVLPLMLASFIFDVLCTPVVSPTGSRPPSRNRNTELPGDEELGFEAAVAALGRSALSPAQAVAPSWTGAKVCVPCMKTTVSETEHPLLCEGTRRVKGDLALALMITYKDDQCKLKKELEAEGAPDTGGGWTDMLDAFHSHVTLQAQVFEGPRPLMLPPGLTSTILVQVWAEPGGPPRPSQLPSDMFSGLGLVILDKLLDRESQTHKPQTLSSFYSSKPATGSQRSPSKHAAGAHSAVGAAAGGVSKHGPSSSSSSAAALPAPPSSSSVVVLSGEVAELKPVQSSTPGEGSAESREHDGHALPADQQNDAAPFKLESTVPSRLALGARCGYSQRCWGSPVRQKKKHTGQRQHQQLLLRLAGLLLLQRLSEGGGRGEGQEHRHQQVQGRRPECHAPHVPNQPSEAAAHFYFELAKTVLIKAGGNSSTSIFTQPSASGGHQGPHRNLHLCAFEIGLYALGLHNFVSPNWLSRTYSSHVSWITGQAMEIGSAALNILVECWDGHLTPPEVASLADRASRARDPNMVRAAAELALSCLPHAHALNPNEIQRALVQCKEQDNVMLEKACMAVEEAAKGGGVYPEVLFEVAHQWYWLYEQSVGGGPGQQREVTGRCGANGGPGRRPPETTCSMLDSGGSMEAQGMAAVTASVTATAVVPVISVGSTIYQSHPLPGQPMAHPHSQALHPYTTIQAHLPTVCSPQYLGHTLQHVPRPAVFPVSGAAYPQGMHPAFIGAQYPFSLAAGPQPPMTATAVTFPGVPVPSMTQIAVHPYHSESGLPLSTTVAGQSGGEGSCFHARKWGSPVPTRRQTPQLAGSPPAPAVQAIPPLSSQPSSLISTTFPAEDEQHSQPISTQGLHYLHSAYRVALEMLGRRAHNDHPNNFSRSPPYTEDVKWLLGLAARLGESGASQPSARRGAVTDTRGQKGDCVRRVSGLAERREALLTPAQVSAGPGARPSEPLGGIGAAVEPPAGCCCLPAVESGLHSYRKRIQGNKNLLLSPPRPPLCPPLPLSGVNYVYQFCVGAAKGVLSPFVLQEIIMEALQRLNPAHVHAHLRTPAFHQLVQRCQQAYLQYIHHRLIHLTPADYDDFVNIIRSARSAFCLTPVGMMQFNDVLQNLKRGKQTKELWQRISLEMATFSP
ncbi:unnamed protein product [Tetraodon nigroviridis]|uniref:(spotted green pufferfish) hypothetical protein n=1 Tax=Tetraodon nigroviridis TaxID=99883 RepID=Q4T1T3_TETNG|nr:unnamed protein product [Tetraodon nigroviridis]